MANWFYYEGSTKRGPIDSTTLKSLAQHGVVKPETPIETEAGKISTAGKIKGLSFCDQHPVPKVVERQPSSAGDADEQILFEGSPSFLRNNISWIFMYSLFLLVGFPMFAVQGYEGFFLGFFFVVFASFILLIIWLECRTTRLTITNHKSILRKGILSRQTIELLHEHIRSVRMSQEIHDRVFGLGRIDISSAASGVAEISIAGIQNPEQIKKLIQQYQRQ